MTEEPCGTVIVGASTAGLATAEALRELGCTDPITLIGDEPHLPYSRPALTKQVLSGGWTPAQATLVDAVGLQQRDVRVLVGVRATRLNLQDQDIGTVRVQDARTGRIRFRTLVIATGVTPRRHPAVPTARTVRTLDDVLALRAAWSQGPRVAVIGGGVLGCELASAARGAGLDVEIITRDPGLRPGRLGRLVDERVELLFARHGVRSRCCVDVVASRVSGRVTTLELSDGSHVEADLVLAAIGSEPAVDWLRGSGLEVRDGVLCAPDGQAAPGVYAVGDVSRAMGRPCRTARADREPDTCDRAGPRPGRHPPDRRRSGDPAAVLLDRAVRDPDPGPGVLPARGPLHVVAGDIDGDRFVAACGPPGAVSGVVGWSMAREFRLARALVTEQGSTSTTTNGALR
jgi:NADPH-dependent 2,4-dienoyl-CoA reductase/sulfur reductase-like enzyme